MKWIALACLAAAGGVWAWAFSGAAERPRPAPGISGSYRLYRFEPPEEKKGTPNPFALGSTTYFDLRDDGTFRTLVFSGRRELMRAEGFLRYDGRRLELEQISKNRILERLAAEAYTASWKEDGEGKFLLLTHDKDRYQLFLRPGPVTAEPASSER